MPWQVNFCYQGCRGSKPAREAIYFHHIVLLGAWYKFGDKNI
jgi:hypothetical protein